MDRPLSHQTLRRRRIRQGVILCFGAVGLVLAWLLIYEWAAPSLARDEIRTAHVERGEVSTTITAAGSVVPAHERVSTAPFTAPLQEVFVPLGAKVAAGEAVLRLQSDEIEREINRLREELRLKDLEAEALLQAREREARELESRRQLLLIDLQSQENNQRRYEALYARNIVSEYDLEGARLAVDKTRIQLRGLEKESAALLAAGDNSLEQLTVQQTLLHQQLAEQERLLAAAVVRAPVGGILAGLEDRLGIRVGEGEEVLRISDLSRFRIAASVSDFYLPRLQPGLPALVNLGARSVRARLSQVRPTIDNGGIGLELHFEEAELPALKPNLRVELEIQTDSREDALRLRNGPVFNGPGRHELWVLANGRAHKRAVEVGLTNSRHVEILSGLAVGEEVIVSALPDFGHLDSIDIKNAERQAAGVGAQ